MAGLSEGDGGGGAETSGADATGLDATAAGRRTAGARPVLGAAADESADALGVALRLGGVPGVVIPTRRASGEAVVVFSACGVTLATGDA